MTFAPDVPIKETLRLTAEADSAAKESQDFSNLVVSRTAEDASEGWYSVALAKSKGSISSRVLKVAKGDQLSLSARATYDQEKIVTPIENIPTIAEKVTKTAMAAGGLLAVQDVTIGGETKSKSLNFNFLAAVPFVKTLLSKTKNKDDITIPYKAAQPKGYVEIALYKDSTCREYLYSKQLLITDKGAYFWEFLQDSVSFDTDGFAVVSLRNESDKAVLFDDLRVDLFGTAEAIIVQENHYEPFGMTLRGLDYVLNEKQKNNFLYNGGVERQEELDLYWDDSHARGYNMQTGRFEQIDPLGEKYTAVTGYNFSFNNPINLNDPSGLEPNYTYNWDKNRYEDEKGNEVAWDKVQQSIEGYTTQAYLFIWESEQSESGAGHAAIGIPSLDANGNVKKNKEGKDLMNYYSFYPDKNGKQGGHKAELTLEEALDYDVKNGLQSQRPAFILGINVNSKKIPHMKGVADGMINQEWALARLSGLAWWNNSLGFSRSKFWLQCGGGNCANISKEVLKAAGYDPGFSFVYSTPSDLMQDFTNNTHPFNYMLIYGNQQAFDKRKGDLTSGTWGTIFEFLNLR